MAAGTKSLGHLGVATGVTPSSGTATDMTACNGSAAAADFVDFNGTLNGINPLSATLTTIAPEQSTTVYCNWFGTGTRHAARIQIVDNNFSWAEDSEGRVIEDEGQSGDSNDYIGVETGESIVSCDYDDGYNTTGYGEETITVEEA